MKINLRLQHKLYEAKELRSKIALLKQMTLKNMNFYLKQLSSIRNVDLNTRALIANKKNSIMK